MLKLCQAFCLNLLYEREINMNEQFYRIFAEEVFPNTCFKNSTNSKDIILAKYISCPISAKIISKEKDLTKIQFADDLFGEIPGNQLSIYPSSNDFTNVGDIINVKIIDNSSTSVIASRKRVQEDLLWDLQRYRNRTVMCTIKEVNEAFIWVDLGNGILGKILNNDLFFYTGYRINFIKKAFLVGEKVPIYIKYFSETDKYFTGSYRYAFPSYEIQKGLFRAGQILCCIVTGETNNYENGYFVFVNPYVNGIVDIPTDYEYAPAIDRGTRITAYVKKIGKKGLHLNIITPYQIDDRS